jgi:hypothetical protein
VPACYLIPIRPDSCLLAHVGASIILTYLQGQGHKMINPVIFFFSISTGSLPAYFIFLTIGTPGCMTG